MSLDLLSTLPSILFGKVDCVTNEDIYWKEKIETTGGFPHIKVYINGGAPLSYDDEREKSVLYKFITRINEKKIHNIDNEEGGLDHFKSTFLTNKNPIVVLSHNYNEDLDENILTNFNYVCKRFEIIECGIIIDNNVNHVQISIIRDFTADNPMLIAPIDTYLGLNGGDTLYNWINIYSYPTLTYFNENNRDLLFSNKRIGYQIHVLVIVDSNNINFESFLNDIHQSIVNTSNLHGKCVFAYINVNDDTSYIQDTLETVGIDKTSKLLPSAVIVQTLKTKINFYNKNNESIDGNSVIAWVNNIFQSNLKPSKTISMD